ncbi:MAG: hypothetical protein DWQ05_18550 [Calditrichaeota bacterium]|nr:MAG: hypothetical protein DWQ05_18550 [Calditrichota bacterium]
MAGVALIAYGIISGQATPEVFLNWQGVAIVFGGTIAATFISHPSREVFRGFMSYFIIFRSGRVNYIDVIDKMVTAIRIGQRDGVQAMQAQFKNVRGLWIFKDGLQMLVNGYTREEVKTTLEDQVKWQVSRELKQRDLFMSMSQTAPAFGMIGTLIGLINMLLTLQTNPSDVGSGLAIALITTFYGLILANMIFAPIGGKIAEQAETNLLCETLQIEAILLIYDKKNYIFARDKLAAYLNAGSRKKLMKVAGKGALQKKQGLFKKAA